MPYSFHEHTADIRMDVNAKTLNELFQDALLGMVASMNPTVPEKPKPITRHIEIEAPDRTALLIDFLNEALVWVHTKREAYAAVRFLELSEHSLKAELEGYEAESFGEDIKAVTYHEANVEKNTKGTWHTIIIFDI